MTPELLMSIAGILLSLIFSYVPGISDWYEQFDPNKKRVVMLVLLLFVTASMLGLACAGFGSDFGIGVACDRLGVTELVKALIAAIIANQAAYLISPK